VKQYGRRLVLDLGHEYDADMDDEWLEEQINETIQIEKDYKIRMDQLNDYKLYNSTWFESLKSMDWPDDTDSFFEKTCLNTEFCPQKEIPISWSLKDKEPYSIHVEELWNTTNSTPDVVVAVIDSGIANEIKSAFSNLLSGYDFISDMDIAGDGDGRDLDATDNGPTSVDCPNAGWHGTKVASIIAAKHSTGVYGIAQNCSVLSLRVLGLCGEGYANDVTDAIVWAVGGTINGLPSNPNPAKIISLSLSGTGSCPSYLQSAITQAYNAGAKIFSAAGNDGSSNITNVFPANCNYVISVGAIDKNGNTASFSNKGATMLAPGVDVVALLPSWYPQVVSGTSFAVSHVTGKEALNNNGSLLYFLFNYSSTHEYSHLVTASSCHPATYYCSGSCCPCPAGTTGVSLAGTHTDPNNCVNCLAGEYMDIESVGGFLGGSVFIDHNGYKETWYFTSRFNNAPGYANCFKCQTWRYLMECGQDCLYLFCSTADNKWRIEGWDEEGIAFFVPNYIDVPCTVEGILSMQDPNQRLPTASCYLCSQGTYNTAAKSTACVDCVAGKFAPRGGLTTCQNCLPGYFQGETGKSACTFCNKAGFYCPSGAIQPIQCAPNTYCPLGASLQRSCPDNTYSPAQTVSLNGCIANQGYYGVGSAVAICEEGFRCVSGTKTACEGGTFASTTGMSTCIGCSPGSYSLASATTCTTCSPGFFAAGSASTSCTACAAACTLTQHLQSDCSSTTNRVCCNRSALVVSEADVSHCNFPYLLSLLISLCLSSEWVSS